MLRLREHTRSSLGRLLGLIPHVLGPELGDLALLLLLLGGGVLQRGGMLTAIVDLLLVA